MCFSKSPSDTSATCTYIKYKCHIEHIDLVERSESLRKCHGYILISSFFRDFTIFYFYRLKFHPQSKNIIIISSSVYYKSVYLLSGIWYIYIYRYMYRNSRFHHFLISFSENPNSFLNSSLYKYKIS